MADRQIDRHTQTHKHTHTQTHTDTQTHTNTHTHTHTHTIPSSAGGSVWESNEITSCTPTPVITTRLLERRRIFDAWRHRIGRCAPWAARMAVAVSCT